MLLLDEPMAALTAEERQAIAELLIALDRHWHLAIVLIERDFELVERISTRMLVLHEGKLLVDGTVHEVVSAALRARSRSRRIRRGRPRAQPATT